MMSIAFDRVQTPAQLATVAALAHEIWYEFYLPLIGRAQVDYMVAKFQSVAAMTQQIETERYEYFLVRREAQPEPIGYCALQPQPEHGQLFISKFYLLARARGSGTGRACMEFIEQLARERGLGLLWLTVNKGNPTVGAYKHLGFHIAADLVMDIGGGFVMDDYRMEKQLR
jgi:diamine N-acetyltransferase